MSRSGTVTMRGIVCLLEQALTGLVRFFLFFLSDPLRIPFCENDGKFSVFRFILSTYVCIPFFFLFFVYSLLLNSQSELLFLIISPRQVKPLGEQWRWWRWCGCWDYFESIIFFRIILIVFSSGKFTLPFSTLFNPILYLIYGGRVVLL